MSCTYAAIYTAKFRICYGKTPLELAESVFDRNLVCLLFIFGAPSAPGKGSAMLNRARKTLLGGQPLED